MLGGNGRRWLLVTGSELDGGGGGGGGPAFTTSLSLRAAYSASSLVEVEVGVVVGVVLLGPGMW